MNGLVRNMLGVPFLAVLSVAVFLAIDVGANERLHLVVSVVLFAFGLAVGVAKPLEWVATDPTASGTSRIVGIKKPAASLITLFAGASLLRLAVPNAQLIIGGAYLCAIVAGYLLGSSCVNVMRLRRLRAADRVRGIGE